MRAVYAHIAHHQPHPSVLLAGYLVVTFAKCGAIEDALHLSQRLSHRSVFSWTAIISACADFGRGSQALELHDYMLDDGVDPNAFTYASLFKACGNLGDLEQGKILYDAARKKGFLSHAFVANSVVCMYGKCGALVDAEDVFTSLPDKDAVSWNAMLSAYVEQGEAERVLLSYRQMQEEHVDADELTFVMVLQGCGIFSQKESIGGERGNLAKAIALEVVHCLHKGAASRGYASHTLFSNTLMSAYGKCGATLEAEDVFCKMCIRSVVSWNVMLSQYNKADQAERSLLLYMEMHVHGISPNTLTFVSALQACCKLARKAESNKRMLLDIGRALQIDAQTRGCLTDILVGNTLLSMYGRCGSIVEAEEAFGVISQRDLVSWNVMLSAYVEQNMEEKAFLLYVRMVEEGTLLDNVTFTCMLQACSVLGSLDRCSQLYFDVVSSGYDLSTSATAPLVHAYANCASMADASAVWSNLCNLDIVAWTACIAGHAGEGSSLMSLHTFVYLIVEGNKPDGLSLTSALSACIRGGLVAAGLELFEFMRSELGLTPDAKHLDCLVDLFARAGDLKKVESILQRNSHNAGLTSWLHLLGACRIHGDLDLAKHAFDCAVSLQPKHSIAYVLMSSVYADNDSGQVM